MNKLEITFDFDKLADEKPCDIAALERLVDSTCIAAGLRKEGGFYIEDNPDPEDGLGEVMAAAFVLMENEGFRHCVKTLRCYWWDERDQEFEMEDLGKGVMAHWGQYKRGDLSFEKVNLPKKVLTPHNKIEIIIDDELIEKEGRITVGQAHDCIDAAAIESMGLRKEGNFYIEDNPQDGFGKVLSFAMFLAKRSWFQHYARKMVCYWWNEDWQDFEAEDVLDTLVINPLAVK